MKPTSGVQALPVYATDSDYCAPPSSSERRKGVIPLDTLPAQWWNQMWNSITQQENNITSALNNIFSELNNVLAEVNETGSATDLHQIQNAIVKIHKRIASTDVVGSVASSISRDGVSVNQTTGEMTVPYMGDVMDLTTPIKTTLVDSINSLNATLLDIEQALRNKIDTMVGQATTCLTNMIDTCIVETKQYADLCDSATLTCAKSYADLCDSATLTCAKSYADGCDSATLTCAKSYADGCDSATLTCAKCYADGCDSKYFSCCRARITSTSGGCIAICDPTFTGTASGTLTNIQVNGKVWGLPSQSYMPMNVVHVSYSTSKYFTVFTRPQGKLASNVLLVTSVKMFIGDEYAPETSFVRGIPIDLLSSYCGFYCRIGFNMGSTSKSNSRLVSGTLTLCYPNYFLYDINCCCNNTQTLEGDSDSTTFAIYFR